MSIESAKAFIERMKTDEEFAKKVMDAKDAQERNAVVQAEGFEFTATDIENFLGELNDDELDNIAGGAMDWRCWPLNYYQY